MPAMATSPAMSARSAATPQSAVTGSRAEGAVADDVGRPQLGQLLGGEAELAAEDLLVVLPERRRRRAHPLGGPAVEPEGDPGHVVAADDGVVDRLEE